MRKRILFAALGASATAFITAVPAERETIVGLQEKFLYMLTLLQGADARPTPQALSAIAELQKTLAALKTRWSQRQ